MSERSGRISFLHVFLLWLLPVLIAMIVYFILLNPEWPNLLRATVSAALALIFSGAMFVLLRGFGQFPTKHRDS